MNALPLEIYTADQVRALDRAASAALGEPTYTLMLRAGEAAFALLRRVWPSARRVVVVCGPGNNGGDGYVLARLAREAHLDVVALTTVDTAGLKGDARRAHDEYLGAAGVVEPWREARLVGADVIVDAMFGTGLSRPLDAQAITRIDAMNASGAPILALDIPSGLHADTGAVLGAAVEADHTISFVGLKLGLYLGEGPDHVGAVACDQLGAPAEVLSSIAPSARRIDERELARLLPRRRRTTHKGAQGKVLIVGGGLGMAGAARMAGEAALRVGAGLVTVATRPENVAAVVAARPELICRAVQSAEADLQPLLAQADVVALGPGLGQDDWAQEVFAAAIGAGKSLVIDADGLNLLARNPQRGECWVLTPHPGEAARLLNAETSAIQRDRLGSVRALSERYGGVAVLKGAGTLVQIPGELTLICDRGNPGMATPGMGDVLTGVIAGLAAQIGEAPKAAALGVLVHAMAGDLAAARGERGMIATDLFMHLQQCVNPAPHT